MTVLKQGWGFPLNSRKAHYFLDGEMISVCRRMMYAGEREDNLHDSNSNCAECKRKRARLPVLEPAATPAPSADGSA